MVKFTGGTLMNKLHKLLGFGLISLLTLSACGTDTNSFSLAPAETVQISGLGRGQINSSAVIEAFVQNVTRLGVRLNDNQLKEISIQRHVTPSGIWASRPALNLSSEANLNTHFLKHKNEFKGINTPGQYLQRAIEFQNRQTASVMYYFDTTSFDKGYQSNVVKFDVITGEFGAMKNNGDITTYYTSKRPNPDRFIVVPESFSF
jgi:hypothetical protein